MKKKIILTTILGLFLAFAIVVLIVNVREYYYATSVEYYSPMLIRFSKIFLTNIILISIFIFTIIVSVANIWNINLLPSKIRTILSNYKERKKQEKREKKIKKLEKLKEELKEP